MKAVIAKALSLRRLTRDRAAGGPTPDGETLERIVGTSPQILEVCKLIGQVAGTDVTVLIRGESGTGKELVARAIHRYSRRKAHPFVAVNCAAIPEPLLEAELFGSEKGAYTGAFSRRIGRFEQASGGTILLDEIGDMSLAAQSKVLRVLADQIFERLGGRESVRVDVRVLAATHRDLEALVRQGRFREDLFYRVNVVPIPIPPLRERKADIPLLAEHILKRCTVPYGLDSFRLADAALKRLVAHDWPGNVRELEHCLQKAVVLSKGGVILSEHITLDGASVSHARTSVESNVEGLREMARQHLAAAPGRAFQRLIEQAETQIIFEALQQTKGNLAQAARILGVSRPTLRDKIARYQIERTVKLTDSPE
jgi:DNA-binding NtrC family response regulator